MEIEITFIGDMPKVLFGSSRWRCLRADLKDLCFGDIVFVKKRTSNRLITHVAFIIDQKRVFHCSSSKGKATIESIDAFFSEYEQAPSTVAMLRYRDFRSLAAGEKMGV